MKKIKLNKKLFLNKDVVSNLNGKHLNAIQGGTEDNCKPARPKNRLFADTTNATGCSVDCIVWQLTGISVCDCPPTDDCINA